MSKTPKAPRLTREQIKAGLETVPLDTILLGTNTESRLTPKQKAFARSLALGNSKAQAYREAYSDKGNKKTQAANGWKEAQKTEIQQIKQAYEVAIEAAKQRTPAQLRELVIHQLTAHAISEAVPPAQRIQALKLLGTVSEVAAFTERKEVTNVRKSEDVRSALMEKLRTISGSAVDAVLIPKGEDADSLLAEISAGHASNAQENAQPAADSDPAALDPTRAPPPSIAVDHLSSDLHSVLHSQPLEKSVLHSDTPEISDCELVDAEVIGLDVDVSSHIEVIAPIVAEKVPANEPTNVGSFDPTPSDMETPHVN